MTSCGAPLDRSHNRGKVVLSSMWVTLNNLTTGEKLGSHRRDFNARPRVHHFRTAPLLMMLLLLCCYFTCCFFVVTSVAFVSYLVIVVVVVKLTVCSCNSVKAE